MNTVQEKMAYIRSLGYRIRECDSSLIQFIITDPEDDEDGWTVAGGPEVLDETIEHIDA